MKKPQYARADHQLLAEQVESLKVELETAQLDNSHLNSDLRDTKRLCNTLEDLVRALKTEIEHLKREHSTEVTGHESALLLVIESKDEQIRMLEDRLVMYEDDTQPQRLGDQR